MSLKAFFHLQILLTICGHIIVTGDEIIRISSASEFSFFVDNVNSGANYSGTTVLLDSDLSLSEITEPIGKDESNFFFGTFDGQGYTIKDLSITSSSLEYSGLFGYSGGLTIRNVVLDSSCSVTNSYIGSEQALIGGIIGECHAKDGQCNIENSVNMGNVISSGDTSSSSSTYSRIGGIAGMIHSYYYNSYMKNCANYGSITYSGVVTYSCTGGIVGYLSGSGSFYSYVRNCINNGAVTDRGTSTYSLYVGGVTGYNWNSYVENCVNTGEVSSTESIRFSFIGSIAGFLFQMAYLNYCYSISNTGASSLYNDQSSGFASYTFSYDSATFELSGTVSVGSYMETSLIGALNAVADYYPLREYSHWLFNKDSKSVSFSINGRANPITTSSQVILLPSLAGEGNKTFYGWYSDSGCANPLDSFEIAEDKDLYGRFEENTNNYTITFDTKRSGFYVEPQLVQFGTFVVLPRYLNRNHCTIAFWENEYTDVIGLNFTMPARNVTLYAVWKCTHITSPDDFIDLSKVVNSGTKYSGTTVYLESDLSFSGYNNVEPIGRSNYDYFNGTFDGQGYVISNLKISSSSLYYAGLFGFSYSIIIRNIILDSTCSVTNSFKGNFYTYVGGLIASCGTYSGDSSIENSVNMASVTFNGNINTNTYSLYIGGIVGHLSSHTNYYPYVKNCANYGSITHSGTNYDTYFGGVVGLLPGSDNKYVYNCINYGTITHKGRTYSNLYIGGIAGYSYAAAYINNCVSAGKITTSNTPTKSYVGGVAGHAGSGTYIKYCHYTSAVSLSALYADGSPTITGSDTTKVTETSSLVSNLNTQATTNEWNQWLFNPDNALVLFKVGNSEGYYLSSSLIILPILADSWRSFAGWFTDDKFTTPFSESSVSGATTLYGRWNKYTVTLNVNGGDELTEEEIEVEYDKKYESLPTPSRTGYDFDGWYTEDGERITNEMTVSITINIIIYAKWSAKKSVV